MSRVLLDTNAFCRLLAGDDRVLDEIAAAERVHFSIFVLGELLAGFRGGNRFEANHRILLDFMSKPTVKFLGASMETAEYFAQIKDALRRAGTLIPINDVWIAAQAMETGSILVSYDQHFRCIPGLRLWRSP